MKQLFILILAILSLTLSALIGRGVSPSHAPVEVAMQQPTDVEHFSPADRSMDLVGRPSTQINLLHLQQVTRVNTPARRNLLPLLLLFTSLAMTLLVTATYSEGSNYAIIYQSQRRIFFILRNIRI